MTASEEGGGVDDVTKRLLRDALLYHPELLVAWREVEEGTGRDLFEPWIGDNRYEPTELEGRAA